MRRSIRGAVAAAAAAAAVGASLGAIAGEVVVSQKDRMFLPGEVALKAGDTLTFTNDDYYGHNVYSESAGGEFDIGLQEPGQRKAHVFTRTGTFEVRCRIHPKMRLKVSVAP